MFAKIFITRQGYDPEKGKHVKDPYLGPRPSIGGCRPDIRRKIIEGGHIFVVSGKVPGIAQFVMGGFQVAKKIDALAAFQLMPEQRLHVQEDGQLAGNIIIDDKGNQHPLDNHRSDTFEKRIENYIVGRDPIALLSPQEIARGREQTMDALQRVLRRKGEHPIDLITRFGRDLSEAQALDLREWLQSLKDGQ